MAGAEVSPRVLVAADAGGMARLAARTIGEAVRRVVAERGVCHLMLAGGGTPLPLYRLWSRDPAFPHGHIVYLFGDERCVPPDHADSNYAAAVSALFPQGVPDGVRLHRMRGEAEDCQAEAERYAVLLPERVDVLLLGMGEDGHTASLFPDSPALREERRRVVPVTGPKPPPRRLTITPVVIAGARQVFLLAAGAGKAPALARAHAGVQDARELPILLARNGTWLLDRSAAEHIDETQ
jgi:6-phosphogluconolactonase